MDALNRYLTEKVTAIGVAHSRSRSKAASPAMIVKTGARQRISDYLVTGHEKLTPAARAC